MRGSTALLALFVGGSLFSAASAFGHAELTDPVPRGPCENAMNCKTSPCGTVAAGAVTKTFFVGSSYDIAWDETIEHPGNYRLALSTNGELGFENFIIEDLIPDMPNAPTYSTTWTVPDTANCNPCVMQLIQIMTDNPGTTYYNCADIRILPAGAATPTPDPTATPTPNPGNNDDPIAVDGYGSCAVGLGAAPVGVWLGLLAIVLLRRRS